MRSFLSARRLRYEWTLVWHPKPGPTATQKRVLCTFLICHSPRFASRGRQKCTSLATRKMQQHSASEHKPSHTRGCSSSVHSEGLDETALAAATPSQGRRLWWWDFSFRPDHHPTSRHYGPATVRYPLARTLTKSRLVAAPLSTQRHRPACILFARPWQHASLGGTTNT